MPLRVRPGGSFVSLRVKFLGIVLGAALGPLVILGVWLTRSAERSGERLLHTRLDTALSRISRDVGSRWVRERSALLTVAESPELRRALIEPFPRHRNDILIPAPSRVADMMGSDVQMAVVRDRTAQPRWTVVSRDDSLFLRPFQPGDTAVAEGADGGAAALPISFNISESGSPATIGTLEARLRGSAILESGAANAVGVGAVLAAVDRVTAASLVPVPFDAGLLTTDRFVWAGEEWLAVRSDLDEPRISLVTAAPLAPFVAPFEQAARAGAMTLAVVAIGAFLFTLFFTSRITRSLERLALSADAVSRGDLNQHVESAGRDEVGRVADAFNAMTENLRETLRRLSQREAAAVVGEFASTIAHEVRNPMSVIRLRLQHAEEQVDARSAVGQSIARALQEVERVERTVAGTLRIARSGRIELGPIDLRCAIDAARRTAAPEFSKRSAILEPFAGEPVPLPMLGNTAALEQVFVNLLVNAAQALEPGGWAALEIAGTASHHVVVVCDSGRGLARAELEHAFEPFYSTRADGTGLGLTIVQRIVKAHGGDVAIDSTPGLGTRVRVTLPRLPDV
jgi:signal transduction histidine kinase